MRKLVWAFAGRTYHIVGNHLSRLKKFAFLLSEARIYLDELSMQKKFFASGLGLSTFYEQTFRPAYKRV